MATDAVLPDLPALHDELSERWRAYITSGGLRVRARDPRRPVFEIRRLSIVYGLTAHVHETARILRPFLDGGDISPALIPLVRNMYECALTAQWVRHAEEADAALINAAKKSMHTLRGTLLSSPDPWSRSLADSLDLEGVTIDPTDSEHEAANFKARCDDIDGGARAYWAYKIMCSLNHPTTNVVDAYVIADPADETRLQSMSVEPKPLNPQPWHAFALMSMIWSARAVTDFAPDRDYRNFLRRSARRLHTEADVKLGESYHARIFRAKGKRRAAQRTVRP